MTDTPDRRPRLLERLTLAAYIFFFAVGTISHALDFARRGWRPYSGPPLPLEAFWTALVVLDLAVVVMLLVGLRRAGITLALVIMLCDVFANGYAAFVLNYPGFSIALPLQTAVLGFVLGSFGFLCRTTR